jgi:hypothetical protein
MRKLYDFLLEFTSVPWSEYSSKYGSCGERVQETFQFTIYSKISMELFGITLLFLAFYYLYLNNRFGKYYSNKAWLTVLVLNALVVALVTYFTAKGALDNPSCPVSSQLLWISFINFLLAGLTFFIFSFVFRLLSVMGKQTPHFTTN